MHCILNTSQEPLWYNQSYASIPIECIFDFFSNHDPRTEEEGDYSRDFRLYTEININSFLKKLFRNHRDIFG